MLKGNVKYFDTPSIFPVQSWNRNCMKYWIITSPEKLINDSELIIREMNSGLKICERRPKYPCVSATWIFRSLNYCVRQRVRKPVIVTWKYDLQFSDIYDIMHQFILFHFVFIFSSCTLFAIMCPLK